VRRREQAEKFGDVGLVSDIEDLVSDETEHKEECEKMFRGKWEVDAL
jgi:bacterioferritin